MTSTFEIFDHPLYSYNLRAKLGDFFFTESTSSEVKATYPLYGRFSLPEQQDIYLNAQPSSTMVSALRDNTSIFCSTKTTYITDTSRKRLTVSMIETKHGPSFLDRLKGEMKGSV